MADDPNATDPACARDGCGHPQSVHTGGDDGAACTATDCTCVAFVAPAAPAEATAWRMPVMALTNTDTSDKRVFEAFTWRDPPMPLMWQRTDSHGGDPGPTVPVGTITKIAQAGDTVSAEGTFLANPDAEALIVQIREQGRIGVSVDAAATEFYVEFPPIDEEEEMAFWMGESDTLHIEQETLRFPTAEIMGATVCAFPAFAGAYIELADTPAAAPVAASAGTYLGPHLVEATPEADCLPCRDRQAVTASGGPMYPPRDWFADPGFERLTPLTVTDDGRIYGHLAGWGTCHTSVGSTCLLAPHSKTSYAHFHLGALRVAEGDDIAVGRITLAGGHASTALGAEPARQHYDDSDTVVADVRAGEDRHGIWLAGALRPDVSERDLRALKAAPLSGDWRHLGGHLELIAALAVNTPGFPVPRAHVASGAPVALVAAGVIPPRSRARGRGPAEVKVSIDSATLQRALAPVLAPFLPALRQAARDRMATRRERRTPAR